MGPSLPNLTPPSSFSNSLPFSLFPPLGCPTAPLTQPLPENAENTSGETRVSGTGYATLCSRFPETPCGRLALGSRPLHGLWPVSSSQKGNWRERASSSSARFLFQTERPLLLSFKGCAYLCVWARMFAVYLLCARHLYCSS